MLVAESEAQSTPGAVPQIRTPIQGTWSQKTKRGQGFYLVCKSEHVERCLEPTRILDSQLVLAFSLLQEAKEPLSAHLVRHWQFWCPPMVIRLVQTSHDHDDDDDEDEDEDQDEDEDDEDDET